VAPPPQETPLLGGRLGLSGRMAMAVGDGATWRIVASAAGIRVGAMVGPVVDGTGLAGAIGVRVGAGVHPVVGGGTGAGGGGIVAGGIFVGTGRAACPQAKDPVHGPRLAVEAVHAFLAAGQDASQPPELLHGDGGEGGCGVVLGLVVVDLVDGDGVVDDRRLDGLLADDWLDDLVDVVMDMLSGHRRGDCLGGLDRQLVAYIPELRCFLGESSVDLFMVSVVKDPLFYVPHDMMMCFGQNLAMGDGLDGGVVVMLMDLTVYGRSGLFDVGGSDCFLCYGWSDPLMQGGVMVTSPGPFQMSAAA
jgi:hypothetical protein